jgi:hypothetical protein
MISSGGFSAISRLTTRLSFSIASAIAVRPQRLAFRQKAVSETALLRYRQELSLKQNVVDV